MTLDADETVELRGEGSQNGEADADAHAKKERRATITSGSSHPASSLEKKESKESLRKNWSPLRLKLEALTSSPGYETAMGVVILFNVIVMVIEVNADAGCLDDEGCSVMFCDISNNILLGIYTLDLLVTMYIERAQFHRSRWNQLDAVIVFMGYMEHVLALVLTDTKVLSIVRLLRLARIMRVARLFQPIPELYKLIVGFASTTKAIFWGFLMIMMLLLMWAILTVQVVQDFRDKSDDGWCSTAFSNVWLTMIFYFQTLVAGDSWGSCAVPLIQNQPALFVVFGGALIMVQLGFTNLILSVIVDAAATSRDEDLRALAEERRRQQQEDMHQFYNLMQRMDEDESGTLSFEELMTGYHADTEVQHKLMDLGVDENDLGELMKRMDTNGSGHVSYAEFVDHMMRAKNSDDRINFLMLKLQVDQVTRMCESLVEGLTGQCPRTLSPLQHLQDPLHHGHGQAKHGSAEANGAKFTPRQIVVTEEKATPLPSKKDGGMFHNELQNVEERLAALTRVAEAHAAALAEQTFKLASFLRDGTSYLADSSSSPAFKSWGSANDGVAWEHWPEGGSSRPLLQAYAAFPASPEGKARDSPGNNSSTHGGCDSDVISESSIKLIEIDAAPRT
eukprot:gb/GFBE01066499.1/.p1 GENE.gb/GFBE01066499.1/~~gb/GFBE01066499.1/.p1  ORF type:complete len:621 (+),score=133.12 gb/GFBE01066499.1/:1-1863(+)